MSPEEFNQVFRAMLPEVSKFLARRLPAEEIEDFAADLFELAWSKRNKIEKGMELAWLYKSARYLISNHYRKTAGRNRIATLIQEPVAAPSAEAIAIADLTLANAWSSLNPKEAEVLALWAFEGLELKEISKVLEVSENAAGIRLSRAKTNLRRILDEINHDPTT